MMLRFRTLLGLILLLSLFSCGGGGSLERDPADAAGGGTSGGTGGNVSVTRSLQLVFTNTATGEAATELTETTPLTLTATVTDSNGNAVTDTLITYTFQPEGLADFENDTGTSTTGNDGIATVNLIAGQNSGAGEITATLSSGENATTTYTAVARTVGSTNERIIKLAFTETVSGEASTNLAESTPLTLTTTVTDSAGNPVTDTLITYTFSPEGLADFVNDSGTASTGNNGVATLHVVVGDNSGAGEITATLSSGETLTTTYNSAGKTQVSEQPASLDLYASSVQLASSGSDDIELLALVKDINNVLLEGINVTFSANSNANILLSNSGSIAVTGADGIARATLNTLNQPENRAITVTASVTGLSESKIVDIQVVGTQIAVNGPPSVILGSTAEYSIFLSDSDGVGIANQSVEVTSAIANEFETTSFITDGEGQVTVNYTANNSGSDTISANALNAIGSIGLTVQQDKFSFTTSSVEDIPLGEKSVLGVTWLKENLPFSGGDIVLTTTRGVLSTNLVTTDGQGQATVEIESTNAGRAVISAQGTDVDGNIVNARAVVEFIAIDVDNIILTASPNSIGPAGQKSTVTAVLRDAAGNLVKGKAINFNADDVSGGEISPASAVTDSNGLASTVYTSSSVTAENAIKITATEPDSGLVATTNITVADRAQFISIGTGNVIEIPDDTSYLKKFTVFVTDANSNPVNNVELTVTGTPVKYTELLEPNAVAGDANYQVIRPAFYKGYWAAFPNELDFEYWVAVQTIGCANEDIDSDGIADVNEDVNGDGRLTPVNIISIDGNVTTDENGQAIIELRYAKTFAAWGQVKITASTSVSGSESQASQFYTLGVAESDLELDNIRPNNNPFGDGRNFVEDPNNPGTFIDDGANLTCTNAL